MPDFQRVVELLRDIRQGPLQTVTDEITQLAADYAALCVQANDRLRKCSTFLQQGLRTEAIHLAEESPNLLDLVAALDLPDQQAWFDFCQNNGLAVPPPLSLDRASQLNDAYAQDQPMEHLLARHRLLALSRAPVRERLEVLRKISSIDGANPNWEKDIRIFEKARLRELPTAFYTAVRNRDNRALVNLQEEVLQQTWYEPVPQDLSSAVSQAFGRIQRAAMEAELQKLVPPLRDAFVARSLHECQALVQRWKNIMAQAGIVDEAGLSQLAPELMDEIRPVVTFINQQTRHEDHLRKFRDACRVFTGMLDRDEPDSNLEGAYARLKEFQEEIPEDLTKRYLGKKAGRRQAVERSHKVRLVAIASVAGVIVIVALALTFLWSRANATRSYAARISAAVRQRTQKGMEEAAKQVEQIKAGSPGMLSEPVVAAAVSEFQTEQSEFARDQSALQSLINKADGARTAAAPVAANASASMSDIRNAAVNLQAVATELANAAKPLAWADSANRLPAATENLLTMLGSMRERVNAIVRTEIESITQRLDAVPADFATPSAASEARNQLIALADRVSTLHTLPLLSDDAQSAISALDQKLVARRSATEASRTVAEELQNIRQHTDSPGELQSALQAFVTRFPDDPRTHDFSLALARIPAATAISDWQDLVPTLGPALSASSIQAMQKRLDSINAYLSAYPESPIGPRISLYADYLKRAVDALSEKGTWQNAFGDLVSTPTLADLATMDVSDGRRYYVLGDVKRVERRINTQVSVTFEALNLKDLTKRTRVNIDPPATVSSTPVPVPHTKVVSEIADNIKVINEDNWDSYGIDLADRLARNDQIDLVVKAILLLQALKTEQSVAGWALGDTYERIIADLSRQTPDQLPWLEPNRISDGTRKALRDAIDSLPAAAAKAKLAAARTALFKSLNFNTLGLGVLLKDDQGAWTLASHVTATPGAQIWALATATGAAPVATSTASTPGALIQVGAFTADKIAFDDAALRNIPQGSIVYITRP